MRFQVSRQNRNSYSVSAILQSSVFVHGIYKEAHIQILVEIKTPLRPQPTLYFLPIRHSGDFTDCHTSLLEPYFHLNVFVSRGHSVHHSLSARVRHSLRPLHLLPLPTWNKMMHSLSKGSCMQLPTTRRYSRHENLSAVLFIRSIESKYFIDIYQPAKVYVCAKKSVVYREYTATGIMCLTEKKCFPSFVVLIITATVWDVSSYSEQKNMMAEMQTQSSALCICL